MENADKQEFIVIESIFDGKHQESAGSYLSRFYTRLRDRGEIWANKCPECGRIVLPPRIVCGFCKVKIEDSHEAWVKLQDEGTIVQFLFVTEHEIDQVTKEVIGDPNPNVFVRLDGGDQFSILAHLLEEGIDLDRIVIGKTRVRAVWRPLEERTGKMTDIHYFKIID